MNTDTCSYRTWRRDTAAPLVCTSLDVLADKNPEADIPTTLPNFRFGSRFDSGNAHRINRRGVAVARVHEAQGRRSPGQRRPDQ